MVLDEGGADIYEGGADIYEGGAEIYEGGADILKSLTYFSCVKCHTIWSAKWVEIWTSFVPSKTVTLGKSWEYMWFNSDLVIV